MKLLVIGGSSFIGRNLLQNAPHSWDVHASYYNEESFPNFVKNLEHIKPVKLDLSDEGSIKNLAKKIKDVDCILYLAANSDPKRSLSDPFSDLQINAIGVVHVLQHLNCNRFIYMSSGAVYLNSPIPYINSKQTAENYIKILCQRKNTSYVILRLFETYGPYSPSRKIFRKLVEHFATGNPDFTLVGNGKNNVDTLYVDDTAKALISVIISKNGNTTVDLCTGHPVTIEQLAEKIAKAFSIKPNLSFEGESVEQVYFAGNPKPMQKLFGFKASISLEEGIQNWRQFQKEHGEF